MKRILTIFFLITLGLFSNKYSYGQTFTYNGGPNCTFTSGSPCWTVSDQCGSGNSTLPLSTAIFNKANGCPVTIIIKANLTITAANITMGGLFDNLIVQDGATLNIVGNVTIDKNQEVTWRTRTGGKINIQGGVLLDAGTSTILNIEGDNVNNSVAANVTVNFIEFANDVKINVKSGAALIVNQDTFISGSKVSLNVQGFFRTSGSMKITGNNTMVNVNTPGVVIVDQDFEMTGQGGMTVTGNSEVEVGGDIKLVGNQNLTVTDPATFKVCGTYVNDPSIPPGLENEVQFGNCRVLPVYITDFQITKDSELRIIGLKFSTMKEDGISHFEIEKSTNPNQKFQKIGEINAHGWKNTMSDYEFKDETPSLNDGFIYYRIKQVSFDQNEIYSKILSAKFDPVAFTSGVWRTYPNPVIDQNLAIGLLDPSSYSGGEITIRIVHPLQSTPFFTSDNLEEINTQLRSWISGFPSGVLIAEIQWEGKMDHLKVLKKD